MSDVDKPAAPPSPPQPQQREKPPREKPQRFKVGDNQKPPSLEHEQSYGYGKSIDAFDDDMEKQLQEAMGGLSDKDLYGDSAGNGGRSAPDAGGGGGQKKGKVFRIHGPDVFIELPGGRTQGLLPMLQFPDGPPEIGTEVDVHIEGFDNANGLLILSRLGAAVHANWDTVAVGTTVEARVTEVNKGGVTVDVNGIRGFMPISQIDLYRVEDAAQFINQKLLCMVTEVEPAERNLVVSRRALLEKEREVNREKLWAELKEGQILEGIVRSVRDFGAFVDLGGVDGLIHISELSWERVKDATSVVQPGQKVKVVVLKLDREQRKVGLGLKQLTASPWDGIDEKYHHGQVLTGKVTRLMDFGAFVELEPGVEGLIHVSELAPQRVRRVIDVVQTDQQVQVMVLSVDPAQRRISLSLKAALPKAPEWAEEEAEEEEAPAAPPQPRTTPLRGGVGQKWSIQ